MKLSELFSTENLTESSVDSDISDMIILIKAISDEKVPIEKLVDQLRSMGYAVDKETVRKIIDKSGIAVTTGDEVNASSGQKKVEDSKAKVSKMAAKAVKKGF